MDTADERNAQQMLRFFKTEPDDYGYGGRFIELKNPQVRMVVREAWKKGYRDELREFLEANAKGMPAIMLSYACEQMSAEERHLWQQRRRS